MNYLTDEELRRNLATYTYGDDVGHTLIDMTVDEAVFFTRAAIRAHMDKLIAECGVEPACYQSMLASGSYVYSQYRGFYPGADEPLFTADQLAAAVAKAEIRGAENERQRLIAECGVEPVAWMYELATRMVGNERNGWESHLTTYKPNVPENSVRNLHPMYTADQLASAVAQRDKRIAELEVELIEQCRINGMGSEREAKLLTRIVELETQLDALKPKEVKRVCGKGGLCYHQPDCADVYCPGRGV